jgi:hypothetical protein
MAKRELIKSGTDKRYVRRNKDGSFKESDDVSRSLATDARQKAKNVKPKNQGDRGDSLSSSNAQTIKTGQDNRRVSSSLSSKAKSQKPVTKTGRVTSSQADKAVRSYLSTRKK